MRLTPAWHTSTTPKGTINTPAGLVIELGDKRIYHLGDTALFSDLALPRRRGHIDVALMCIGGHYTMDRFDAVVAAELVGADQVIPCHYDTFPPIETDAEAFKQDVRAGRLRRGRGPGPGGDPRRVTTAIVLIEAERDALTTLGGALADLEGVTEAWSVTGDWDFVAIVRVPRHEQLAEIITGALATLAGVTRTQTMVAFEVFSRHDLEAMFSIGG